MHAVPNATQIDPNNAHLTPNQQPGQTLHVSRTMTAAQTMDQ